MQEHRYVKLFLEANVPSHTFPKELSYPTISASDFLIFLHPYEAV
jgi:hypothetical protein